MGLTTPSWIQYTEKVVGEGHPTQPDVINRPMKTIQANVETVEDEIKWKVVSDVTVSADSDHVDFTGLDINADGGYRLEAVIHNPTSNVASYSLFVEGDYTDTDYYTQALYANGASVTAANRNNANILTMAAGINGAIVLDIFRDPSGYARAKTEDVHDNTTNMWIQILAWMKSATVTNIASIRISSDQTGGIGAGSRLTLFKKRG